jgi:hypothetical protein
VEVYPSAVQQAESSYQHLPLHCGCRTAADPSIVKALLETECTQPKKRTSRDVSATRLVVTTPAALFLIDWGTPGNDSTGYVGRRSKRVVAVACGDRVGCSVHVLRQVYTAYLAAIALRVLQGSLSK